MEQPMLWPILCHTEQRELWAGVTTVELSRRGLTHLVGFEELLWRAQESVAVESSPREAARLLPIREALNASGANKSGLFPGLGKQTLLPVVPHV